MSLRISGRRRLKSPRGLSVRPTSSRVRQAIFGILQGRIEGCRWLDLCSGAGAMGAEALTLGAAFVLGIDASATACDITRQNWAMVCQPGQSFRIVHGNLPAALRRLTALDPFTIAYFDPPYSSDLYRTVLPRLGPFIAPGGMLLVEHARGNDLPHPGDLLRLSDRRTYGQTQVSIYTAEREPRISI